MELWIRSQNKEYLIKCNTIAIDEIMNSYKIQSYDSNDDCGTNLGYYKTKERALEVLDEIQEKLQNKFLCKPTCVLKAKDIDKAEGLLNLKYKNERFIMQPQTIDIEPINCDIVVYEMPKE